MISIDDILYSPTPWGYIRLGEDIIRRRPMPELARAYRKVEPKPRHVDDRV